MSRQCYSQPVANQLAPTCVQAKNSSPQQTINVKNSKTVVYCIVDPLPDKGGTYGAQNSFSLTQPDPTLSFYIGRGKEEGSPMHYS